MKKKWLIPLSAVALAVVALSAAAWAALGNNPIKLVVNGQEIKPEVPPQIINERVLVPVRWVAEALGAHVEWDDQSNTVKITPGGPEQSEIDLISNYLRQAAGPKQFVENFTRALQNRNGAVARLFLAPEIRNQIRPEVIGTSTPIMEITINESGADDNTYRYNVKAFYGPSGDRPPDLALEMSLTVEPEKYPDGSLGPGRYLIRELQARGPWPNISAEEKIKEAAKVVERYNAMKEKAAQDKWEEVAWKEVVSKRVLQHYTYWQDQVKKEDNPQEFTRNLLRETKMPHLQEMAETALYFLPGGYTWRDYYAGFEILGAQENGSGVEVTVREKIIHKSIEGHGGMGWKDQIYTVIWEVGPSGRDGAFIDEQAIDVKKGSITPLFDQVPDDVERIIHRGEQS